MILTGSDLSYGGCGCSSAPSLQWHAAWELLGMGNMPRGSLRPVACRAGLARKTPSPADASGATRQCFGVALMALSSMLGLWRKEKTDGT